MVKEQFAEWERSHGFASDNFLKAEPSRIGEASIKRKPVPVVPVSTTPRHPELFTRSQWKQRGRYVTVSNSEAMRTITTRQNGHMLPLFGLHQTEEHKRRP